MHKLFLPGMVNFSKSQYMGSTTRFRLYILGLSERHHNSLIFIFESVIGVALAYTRRGRVLPTPGELMGTPNLKYYLCTRMIIDDGG
jgi:hypothetical protein